MAMAFAYPEPEKGGRGKKGKATETVGFSQQRLREARQILGHSAGSSTRLLNRQTTRETAKGHRWANDLNRHPGEGAGASKAEGAYPTVVK